MKSPLIYQLTENNAGEIAIYNCLAYLFDREEIPLEFVKIMSSYALGCYDDMGNLGNKEFCENLLFFAASWLFDYAKEKHIPLVAKFVSRDDVNLLEIRKCLNSGGCIVLKTSYKGIKRYVTITKMDDVFMYMFDPYYINQSFVKSASGVEIVNNEPFAYNRKILIERFVSEKSLDYALGSEKNREAILFYRIDKTREREFIG